MLEIATTSPEETAQVASHLADFARPGDVFVLVGDLGSGKTAFAKAFGQAFGVAETMTSPTFTLAREYRGRLPLHHLDVYRLEQMAEVMDLDLPDLLDSGGVVMIEWGDVIVSMLPPDYLEIRFDFADADDHRLLQISPVGPTWARRLDAASPTLGADVDATRPGRGQ